MISRHFSTLRHRQVCRSVCWSFSWSVGNAFAFFVIRAVFAFLFLPNSTLPRIMLCLIYVLAFLLIFECFHPAPPFDLILCRFCNWLFFQFFPRFLLPLPLSINSKFLKPLVLLVLPLLLLLPLHLLESMSGKCGRAVKSFFFLHLLLLLLLGSTVGKSCRVNGELGA